MEAKIITKTIPYPIVQTVNQLIQTVETSMSKIAKAEKLILFFNKKENDFYTKYRKARKWENKEKWYGLSEIQSKRRRRADKIKSTLIIGVYISGSHFSYTDREYFGKGNTPRQTEYNLHNWQRRQDKKKEAAETFRRSYRVGLWFLQESLNADYGSFTCQSCHTTFYHSPRNVYQGAKQLYNCVCGNCADSFK